MGTKVQCKSYLPGYYTMRDINEDTNSSWPQYYEDRRLNVQFCNGFNPRPLNGYLDYDKEVLKQTILRHEEIFRKQVFELHRLYRKQRDLMEELKRNREQNFSMQVQSSQSRPISAQMLPKDTEISQMHGHPSTSASCGRVPISGVDESQTHLSSLEESGYHARLMSRENGSSQVNQLLDSRVKKLPRKMLDLELPAEAYIDNEDVEYAREKNVIKPPLGSMEINGRNSGLKPENNVKLTLGTAQDPCSRDETWKLSSDQQNGLQSHNLADLNEPPNEVSCEEVVVSTSKFPVRMTYPQGLQGHQRSMESTSSFIGLQKDLFPDTYSGGGSASVFLHTERDEKGQEWKVPNNEIGAIASTGQYSGHVYSFTSSLSNKNARPLSEPGPVEPDKDQDSSKIFSLKQDKTELWFREKQPHDIELSDRSYHTAIKTYAGLAVPTAPSPHSAQLFIDRTKTASPLVSSWRKPSDRISHTPTAVQTFPCFSGSVPLNMQGTSSQNLGNASDKWQCNRDFKSLSDFGGETYFHPSGFLHGFRSESAASSSAHLTPISLNNGANTYNKSDAHGPCVALNGLHCMDGKTAKGMILNLQSPNGYRNGSIPEVKVLYDVEGKKESLSSGICWLRTKTPCSEPASIEKDGLRKDLAPTQGPSQLLSSYSTSGWELEQKEASSSLEVLQDLPSILKAEETQIQQNEAAATSSNKRILGFSVPQGTQQSSTSFTSVSHREISLDDDDAKNRAKEGLHPTDSACRGNFLDLEKPALVELDPEKDTAESVNYLRSHINLNSSATSTDQAKSPESTSKDETRPLSPLSVRGTATRFACTIDLEAPATPPAEEQAPFPDPAQLINQLVLPVEPESRKETPQATETVDEELSRIAAETLHKISLERPIHLEDAVCHPVPLASVDALHWFADLVTSSGENLENMDGLKGGGDVDQVSSDIEGMGYFEYMTLNLTDARADEYFCTPLEKGNPEEEEEEEIGVARLLLTRPRRGQARRRRQRRDFQRDILPGLASLSRQEVTEDLQVIGGLMRATGRPWQACGARRNAGRSRARRQPKGGGRPSSKTAPAAAAAAVVLVEAPVDPLPRQPSKEEAEVEGRSILGWGRTTKRCRRQRCPPGNGLPPSPR